MWSANAFLLAWLSVFVGAASTIAETLSVPGDFASIQSCIDAAVSGADECVVAPGTYNEIIDFLGKAITVRSSNGPEVTIIDAGPVADLGAGKPVVRCVNGEGADTVLDGFTITGGTGDSASLFDNHLGGGMFNLASSPTVNNCTFVQNTADGGGGMYNSGLGTGEDSNPTVTNCTFLRNNALVGGGVFIRSDNNQATLANCTFRDNTAERGAGMYTVASHIAVTDCTFANNTADFGGGMYNVGGNPSVNNCTFIANTANNAGGGMLNGEESNATITDCLFLGNSAAINGGGIHNAAASPTLINCVLSGNHSDGEGGGIYNKASFPVVTNCTISENSAGTEGGGMYSRSSSHPTLTNCVLWGNQDAGGTDESAQLDHTAGIVITVDHSCIEGWTGSLGGTGNIGGDPLFVDAEGADATPGTLDDDLRLSIGSACIDLGDNAAVTVTTGLDGNPRIVDGDLDGTATVDMGAYELPPPPIPTVSTWGMLSLVLLMMIAGTVVLRQRAVT